ncbi:MAG: thiamine-phosphate kinase [Pseudorhodoplanes sp.]|nr:thiamine-phosphate kinase [Pseudorhodoplanes sp.]
MPSAEDNLIARFFKPLATHPGAFGLADDAAVFAPPPGHEIVLKTDAVIAGVHFLPDDPPDTVARKASRANLSDLAGKGAQPAGFLLSIALPKETDEAWLARFCAGLASDALAYGCPLFGGDTDRTPGLLAITILAFGTVPAGRMVQRAGATPGDVVAVSGSIGDAALGLKLRRDPALAARWSLSDEDRDFLLARYRIPEPRVALAPVLRECASAAMDISDGLAGDLAKLCRVSNVTASVEVAKVPLSPGARRALAADPALREPVLTGGDDYEILFTVPAARWKACAKAAAEAGVVVAAIGTIEAGDAAPVLIGDDGQAVTFARLSYSHF